MKVIHYVSHAGLGEVLKQHQLQALAKDIVEHGLIVGVTHSAYSTNEYNDAGEMDTFLTGRKCIEVSGFRCEYHIHLHGLRVTEIIETIL